MKKIVVLLSLSLLAMPALAATAQQEKMKTCNAKAKGLKGDEFKKVRDECLKAQPAAAGTETNQPTPQQARMKQCNADAAAKSLKGEERKKFMSDCLKAR